MIMDASYYLDSEILKSSNYPELKQVLPQINALEDFAMMVNSAIAGYVEGVDDKVFIDMHAVAEHIELCRDVLDTLGMAENPCFDVIVDLRAMLEVFYELTYTHRKYGREYIDFLTTTHIPDETTGGDVRGN